MLFKFNTSNYSHSLDDHILCPVQAAGQHTKPVVDASEFLVIGLVSDEHTGQPGGLEYEPGTDQAED